MHIEQGIWNAEAALTDRAQYFGGIELLRDGARYEELQARYPEAHKVMGRTAQNKQSFE